MARPLAPQVPRTARGLTLVELLVAAALGLFIVAMISNLFVGQLRTHRGLLVESRLMQELRTATDLVTRDLRRAGHWGAAASGVWLRDASSVLANPYATVTVGDAPASAAVLFRYSRDAIENHQLDDNEAFGLRLRSGVLEMQLGTGGWQALTDAGSVVVTDFRLVPTVQTLDLSAYCPRGCSGSACPRQQLRSLALQLSAHAVRDPQLLRTLRSSVRLRNDEVIGSCPA